MLRRITSVLIFIKIKVINFSKLTLIQINRDMYLQKLCKNHQSFNIGASYFSNLQWRSMGDENILQIMIISFMGRRWM